MIPATQLTGLPYYGGKQRLASWIAGHLPVTGEYMEPYGGQASVLLSRRPVRYELLNDQAEIVVDWWRCFKDGSYKTLRHNMERTPSARAILADAYRIMRNPDNWERLERAWAFHVIAMQTMAGNLDHGSWRPTATSGGTWCSKRDSLDWEGLAQRIADVELECCDAVDLLGRNSHRGGQVVYVDPPYRHAETCGYLAQTDHGALAEVLLLHTGSVAVSGYPGDWPELDAAGWLISTTASTVTAAPTPSNRRCETLWMNYDPPQGTLL